MSKNKGDTLYEKTMRNLKNNPIVVAILVIGAIAAGLVQGVDIFNKVKGTVFPTEPYVPQISEVQITIQPYDIVTGYTASPAIHSLDLESASEMNAISQAILEQISKVVQPEAETGYRVLLEIKETMLRSDKPVEGGVIVMNSVAQVPARVRIPDLTAETDLDSVFADPATLDPQCGCIHLELHVPTGGFQDATLEIYQLENGYSFEASSLQLSRTMDFNAATVSVLIETPKGEGSDATTLGTLQTRLDNEVRQKASGMPSLLLSPYQSVSDLRAVIDPLIPSIAPGGGKGNVLEQYRVDYVVSVSFVVK